MEEHKARVLSKIDQIQAEVIEVLAGLVRTPSVNPNYPGVDSAEVLGGESRCNEALAQHCAQIGCENDLWEEQPGRANLVSVLKGAGGGRSLIFNGHIDVVPPGPAEEWKWSDPYSGRVEDGKLFGRGACDMKAGVVAQYAAARALVESGLRLKGDLILESVVGEETMEHEAGTSATVKRGYRADGAVVTEPTSRHTRLGVGPASSGSLYLAVTCTGVAGHPGARFEYIRAGGLGEGAGVNAVEKGVQVLTAVQQLENNWGLSKKHDLFPAGFFTLHPGVIIGGPPGPLVPFITSTYCRIEYIIWYPPQQPVETVKDEIAGHIAKAAALDPWLAKHPPTLEWKNHWPPYEIASDHPLVQACAAAREEAVGGVPEYYSSQPIEAFIAVDDASFLSQAGIPSITCGPGICVMAHQCNEYVPVDEVIAAAKTYALLAMDWCDLAPGK